MSITKTMFTSKHNTITISSEDPKIVEHFNSPNSYADFIVNQINTDRFYDKLFTDNMNILDIGGNIGLFSLFAHDSAAAIYPIEPTPDHFYILEELTKDYPNIHPQNVALHNEPGTVDFYINHANSTMNSTKNHYGEKITVPAKTLKNLCDELNLTKVHFVKLDIEGSEMNAITDDTVGEVKDIIDSWFIECHATSADWYSSVTANRQILSDIFGRNGYKTEFYGQDSLYVTK